MLYKDHYEEYVLNNLLVHIDNRNIKLGRVKAKNSSKIPKEKIDLLEVRSYKDELIDINDILEDDLATILEEISILDILAYDTLNQEYYHYRN